MSLKNGNPKNLYNCKNCGNTIVTEDKDEGVTPSSIPCKSFGGCENGRMWLFGYNVPPSLIAGFEWIKNGKEEGLNIRKIQEIRTDVRDPVIGLKTPPTKGLSGKTKFHKK